MVQTLACEVTKACDFAFVNDFDKSKVTAAYAYLPKEALT